MNKEKIINCINTIKEKHKKIQNKNNILKTPEFLKDLKECNSFATNKSTTILFDQNIQNRIKAINEKFKKIKEEQEKIEIKNKKISFFKKTKMYILAELNTIIEGQINKSQYAQRKSACLDCHGRVDSIENKTDPGGIGFCSLCGCGASKRAALSVKLTIGGASCPLNKWESLKGTEWSFKTALQASSGLFTSFYYHFIKKVKQIIRNNYNKMSI